MIDEAYKAREADKDDLSTCGDSKLSGSLASFSNLSEHLSTERPILKNAEYTRTQDCSRSVDPSIVAVSDCLQSISSKKFDPNILESFSKIEIEMAEPVTGIFNMDQNSSAYFMPLLLYKGKYRALMPQNQHPFTDQTSRSNNCLPHCITFYGNNENGRKDTFYTLPISYNVPDEPVIKLDWESRASAKACLSLPNWVSQTIDWIRKNINI